MKQLKKPSSFIFLIIFLLSSYTAKSQEPKAYSNDNLQEAALDIIHATNYCALITLDSFDQPQVRTMNPFPMEDISEIWFATNRNSRKTGDLKINPECTVYWADHNNAIGYVVISGKAEVIDDKALLIEKKRDYWNGIQNWQDVFVLIRIVPESLEVINYRKGINGEPGTNRAPFIQLSGEKKN
ncbi:MAG: pyridoxamine 5'-phosphate oxidase family protein [Prolixibacteraceae bacterium]|nr:pyridoxamine 5'-phosphate oxidase family protein [Prolixibacteraceae bacterium]MBN2774816.1 pyridoxamine 5'-phosphate oxidase family protein [Prolixibacteraceae bacterium]